MNHQSPALQARCQGNPLVTGGFPSWKANNVESASMMSSFHDIIPYRGCVALTSFDRLLCVGRRTLRLIRTCNCRWWPLLWWSLLWRSLLPLLCRVRCLRLAPTSHLRLCDNCARLTTCRVDVVNWLSTRVDVLNRLTTRVDVLDGANSSTLAAKQR